MVAHVGTQGHGTALVPGHLITAECLPGRSPQPIMLPEDEGLSSLDDRVTRAARTHSVAHILQRLGLSRRSKYETDDIDEPGESSARVVRRGQDLHRRALRHQLRSDRHSPAVHVVQSLGTVRNRPQVLSSLRLIQLSEDALSRVEIESVEAAEQLNTQCRSLVGQRLPPESCGALTRLLQTTIHI